MKLYETTVVVLLMAILAIQVYSIFYKTKESYSGDSMVFGGNGQLTVTVIENGHVYVSD